VCKSQMNLSESGCEDGGWIRICLSWWLVVMPVMCLGSIAEVEKPTHVVTVSLVVP